MSTIALFGWKRLWPCYVFAGVLLASVVLTVLTVRWLPGSTDVWERGFRSAGTLLQLFGILTVALGVRNTRKQFNEAGEPGPMKKWVLEFCEAVKAAVHWLKGRLQTFFRRPRQVNVIVTDVVEAAPCGG